MNFKKTLTALLFATTAACATTCTQEEADNFEGPKWRCFFVLTPKTDSRAASYMFSRTCDGLRVANYLDENKKTYLDIQKDDLFINGTVLSMEDNICQMFEKLKSICNVFFRTESAYNYLVKKGYDVKRFEYNSPLFATLTTPILKKQDLYFLPELGPFYGVFQWGNKILDKNMDLIEKPTPVFTKPSVNPVEGRDTMSPTYDPIGENRKKSPTYDPIAKRSGSNYAD